MVHPDDVYILGFLREHLEVQPFYLNLRYSYEEEPYLKWLNRPRVAGVSDAAVAAIAESSQPPPLPYLFAKVDTTKEGWKALEMRLWKKTVEVQNGGGKEV